MQSGATLPRAIRSKLVGTYLLIHHPTVARYHGRRNYMWIGLPRTAIAASFSASLCVGWAWQV